MESPVHPPEEKCESRSSPGESRAPFSTFFRMNCFFYMVSDAFRTLRSVGIFGLLLVALCLAVPQAAQGQLWLQTSRVITPIENGPTRAFLDTLVNVMERKDVMVKRAPNRKEEMAVSALRDKLISEEGIGLSSANHAFIDYRFSIDNGSKFRQEISKVHFVFRPGPNQNDVSIMYIDAEKDWVKTVIRQKGTMLRTNEAALIPFHRHLGFANIARQKKTQVVEIGGQTVREGFDERKKALIQKVERLTYESFV
jgi:hypothetical protein